MTRKISVNMSGRAGARALEPGARALEPGIRRRVSLLSGLPNRPGPRNNRLQVLFLLLTSQVRLMPVSVILIRMTKMFLVSFSNYYLTV